MILLGVPALPIPTGGATHVFEVIAVVLALQLIAGRDEIWLPAKWRAKELAGDKQRKFLDGLMKMIRRLERFSRPRLRFLFHHRLSNIVFGVLVIGGTRGGVLRPAVHRPGHAARARRRAALARRPARGHPAGDRGVRHRGRRRAADRFLGHAAIKGIGSLF